MQRIIKINLLILLFFGLLACGSRQNYRDYEQLSLPTHLEPVDSQKLQLEQRLTLHRVQVIQMGQHVLIDIPSALVFNQQSPKINVHAYEVLNEVACYIKTYRKVEVNVNVHDFCIDKQQRMLALTRAQASTVANYLTSQGIDSRLVIIRGLGNDKPIMKNECNQNVLANSRIEISFKDEII